MTDKLYRIIPGSELTADQWTLIEQENPLLSEGGFAWGKAWYFTSDGKRFLNCWRDQP